MVEKLLLFGIGYVLGTRAGRERFDELVELGKQLAQRDDVQMVANLARGFIEERAAGLTGDQGLRAA
jgi:hypothetical protein